jgi:hypothetical protein
MASPEARGSNMTLASFPGSDTVFGQSRLMADKPHTDGMVLATAESLSKDSANLVLTRNAAGDWSLNRIAAGAETYNCRTTLGELLRLGERYNFNDFGVTEALATPKGIAVTDVFAIYQVGVVDLTTLTLRFGKCVFANNVALAKTDLVAATAIAKAVQANPYVTTVAVPAVTQVFHTDDTSNVEIEVQAVMANTGTLRLYGIGAHVTFNYD